MVKHFLYETGKRVNVYNRYSNVVFDTSIWYNNDGIRFQWHIEYKIVKFVAMGSPSFFIVVVSFMKRKVTRENIN